VTTFVGSRTSGLPSISLIVPLDASEEDEIAAVAMRATNNELAIFFMMRTYGARYLRNALHPR
jgi:hypothetical protein